MNRCPITYDDCGDAQYSLRGLHLLDRKLSTLEDFPYTAEEQRRESAARAAKMSIQGMQPKVSARLDPAKNTFIIVDLKGRFILKPQVLEYPELPENEDLTMKLASTAGIEVPLHGLVYSVDGSRTYFIRRFDREARNRKVHIEDFAQLLGRSRDTKYDSSMEHVAQCIQSYCTFPVVEFEKLFVRVVFNFLAGNEDMHLKNFSLIRTDGVARLAPAYDFLNTTIALRNAEEEMALPLNGKKRKLTARDILKYYGRERLDLPQRAIDTALHALAEARRGWDPVIGRSFLSDEMKEKYAAVIRERSSRLSLA